MDLDTELIRKTAEEMYDVVRVAFTSPRSKTAALHNRQFHEAARFTAYF